jgi:hypothetical protein
MYTQKPKLFSKESFSKISFEDSLKNSLLEKTSQKSKQPKNHVSDSNLFLRQTLKKCICYSQFACHVVHDTYPIVEKGHEKDWKKSKSMIETIQ